MKRRLSALLISIGILAMLPQIAIADPVPAPSSSGSAHALVVQAQFAWSSSDSEAVTTAPTIGTERYGPPNAQTWGWCGIITKEKKVVRRFKKKGGAKVVLFCGGPKYDGKPRWGLRHIQRYHEDDWERKAFGTNRTWRELADVSIAAALADPYVRGKIKDGKHCYSRVIYLWDLRRDRIIGTMIVRVVWRADGDRRIITAYPSDTHCDIR